MKTPFSDTALAILDKHPQRVEYYAAIHRPRIMAWGTLSAIPDNYPGSQVLIKNVVAFYNLADILAGMTLRVGSESNKDDYGSIRVRENYASGSVIKTAEFGSGLVNWKTGACLTVVEEFRAWPIHHSYDTALSTWLVDTKNYTSQLSLYGPQAIMGPPAVTTLDGGKAVVPYVGNLSYSHTPGASIASQAWYFANGETVTSALGSSDAPVNITYINASPNGRYHALAVTDGNGSSHISKRLTFAFGSAADQKPSRVSFEAITGGLKAGGYKTRFTMHDTAPSGVINDGAAVVIFERASYGTIASSVGGNYYGRENVVMVGRVVNESMRIDPFTQELSFALETIDGELRKTNAYDLFLEGSSAASSWDMASNLTLDHAALALTKHRSTIDFVTDFHPASGAAATNELAYRSLPAGNLWEQLTYNYDAAFGLVAADMQGTIWAGLDAQVTGLSANLPNIMAITKSRRLNTTSIEHEHVDTNAQYRLYAIQGGTETPLGAESPGQRSGYYGGRQDVTRNLLVTDQQTLTTWAGNVRARDNNPYKRVSTTLAGNIRLDSVPQSRVTMSLSAIDNRRQLEWSNQVLIPHETVVNYNSNMYSNTDVVMETVVNGTGGSAITFPTPVNTGGGGGGGGGQTPSMTGLVYVMVGRKLVRTRNFSASTPNYETIFSGTDPCDDFILDPYHPSQRAWLVTKTTIYRTTNLNVTTPTWTTIKTSAAFMSEWGGGGTFLNFTRIKATIATEGLFFVKAETFGATEAHVIGHTHDNGLTWTWVTVFSGASYLYGADTIEVGQHNGNVIATGYSVTGQTLAKISIDGGHTFSDYYASIDGTTAVADILIPYNNNPTDQVGYILLDKVGAGTAAVIRTSTQGSAWDDITPSGYGSGAGVADDVVHGRMGDYTPDRQRIYVSDGIRFFYSENEGSTFSLRSTFDASAAFGGFPYNSGIVYRVRWGIQLATPSSGAIFASADGGYTWIDKTGDWGTSVGDYDSDVGYQVIVPDWTAT